MTPGHPPRVDRTLETGGPLEIHINELVLHGFPGLDRNRFGAVVERELARLLDQQRPPMSWHQVDGVSRMDAGRFEVRADHGIETMGISVAEAVYRCLTGGTP